jgi:predicted nucleic acid-binding protein
MTDALQQRVYIESNVFIYAVEGVAATASPARRLIASLRARSGIMHTSEITLAEVLAPPRRPGAWPLHMKRRAYLDLFVGSGVITLVPISRSILLETADLRTVTNLKLPDAIHLASAIRMKSKFLVSGDTDFRRLPAGMILIRPDDEGVESLLRAIA